MTATPVRPPLENALGIPGARSVCLLDPDGPVVLWWAGEAPPSDDQAAAVVTMASAAAGLVMLDEPGDEFSDVILTSAEAFHVVRLVENGTRIAHLSLRRPTANLAMARREFRQLLGEQENVRPPRALHLPRRDRAEEHAVRVEAVPELPDLTALLSGPYSADESVLDRILVTLRSL